PDPTRRGGAAGRQRRQPRRGPPADRERPPAVPQRRVGPAPDGRPPREARLQPAGAGAADGRGDAVALERPARRAGGVRGPRARPRLVQGDCSVLVGADTPTCAEAGDAPARFAELQESAAHRHPYRLSQGSLENAAAAGPSAQAEDGVLREENTLPLPARVAR